MEEDKFVGREMSLESVAEMVMAGISRVGRAKVSEGGMKGEERRRERWECEAVRPTSCQLAHSVVFFMVCKLIKWL